jgi:hypothetical protein
MSEFVALLHESVLLPHPEENLLLFHSLLLEEMACELPEVGEVGHTLGEDLLGPGQVRPNESFTEHQDVVLAVQSEWVFEHGHWSQAHFAESIVVSAVGPAVAVPLGDLLDALGDKLKRAGLGPDLDSNLVNPNVLSNADKLGLLQSHKVVRVKSVAKFSVFGLLSH